MNTTTVLRTLTLLLLPVAANAATLEEYVTACTNNKANRMDADVCTCVGNEMLQQYGQSGLDYMHAGAAKDSAKMHQTLAAMDVQQKTGIMMFSMTAPSKCAGKVAQEKPPAPQAPAAAEASGAATAVNKASEAARQAE